MVSFVDDLEVSIREGNLFYLRDNLRRDLAQLPWWRWLRRLHWERQLRIVELCTVAYKEGARRKGMRS